MDPDKALESALTAHRAGNLNAAVDAYEAIIAEHTDHAGAWLNLGAARRQLGNLSDAISALQRAVELAPDHPGVLYNLANALADDAQLAAAAERLRDAIGADPNFADAYNNLGELMHRQGQFDEASAVLRNGLQVAPGHIGMMTNLANACHGLGQTQDALALLNEAAASAPENADILRNLGNVLRTCGRTQDAEEALRRALSLNANDAEAHCLLAFCQFASGQFGPAWNSYGWRWHAPSHEAARPFSQPVWDGSDIGGKKLLVWGEQAVGDEIMFATMYHDLADQGADITIETEHRLHPLFSRSFPDFRVVERRTPPAPALQTAAFDFQIAGGDLGGHLRPDAGHFERNRPYLKPDPDKAANFRHTYEEMAGGRRRIGISWRSGAEQAGLARSVPLRSLEPLLRRNDCWFVNLQYGDVTSELASLERETGIAVYGDPAVDPLHDLEAAAAQIAALDLVISAANTTVHMAGALGIPTWVLLSPTPDWRWMTTGNGSPWYPTLRLFRQMENTERATIISAVADALDIHLSK